MELNISNEIFNLIQGASNTLKDFYTKVHDGFFYFSSQSMGLVSLNDIVYFDEYDWGIIEDLQEPIK